MSNLGCFISLNLSAVSCQKKSMNFLPLNNTKYWRMPGSGAAWRWGKAPASGFRFMAQLLAHSGGLRASLPHVVSDFPSVKARKYNQHPGTILLYWYCGPTCATHTLMARLAVAFSTFYVTPNIPKKVTTEIITDLQQLPLPRRESKIGDPALPAVQKRLQQIIWLLAESLFLLSPQKFYQLSPRKGKPIIGFQHLTTHTPLCFTCLKPSIPSKGVVMNSTQKKKIVLFKTKGRRKLFFKE